MSSVTLLAIVPSGELLVVRDAEGRMWLLQPESVGEPRPADERMLERAVSRHGFERIDRDFDTWEALEDFRQRLAAQVSPGVVVDRDHLDVHDVREMLAVAKRWAADGEGRRAEKLVLQLLKVPVVLTDRTIHDDLVSLLESLHQPLLDLRTPPRTERHAGARARWQEVMAA